MTFWRSEGAKLESLQCFEKSFGPEPLFFSSSLKRKSHAQYGLQIFPESRFCTQTKLVRQGQKYNKNLNFLIRLKIDIWSHSGGRRQLRGLKNDENNDSWRILSTNMQDR